MSVIEVQENIWNRLGRQLLRSSSFIHISQSPELKKCYRSTKSRTRLSLCSFRAQIQLVTSHLAIKYIFRYFYAKHISNSTSNMPTHNSKQTHFGCWGHWYFVAPSGQHSRAQWAVWLEKLVWIRNDVSTHMVCRWGRKRRKTTKGSRQFKLKWSYKVDVKLGSRQDGCCWYRPQK